MDRLNATMVEQATPQGCRTRCQYPGCGQPIAAYGHGWEHLSGPTDHQATPVETAEPTLTRQALTQPSSLVDVLLEAARHHGVEVVTSPKTYTAAEQAAGMLQQILMPQTAVCGTCGASQDRWPVDHPLYVEGSAQCPWCIQADCAEEARMKRLEDR